MDAGTLQQVGELRAVRWYWRDAAAHSSHAAGAGWPLELKSCPRGKQTALRHHKEVKTSLCPRCTAKSFGYVCMQNVLTRSFYNRSVPLV